LRKHNQLFAVPGRDRASSRRHLARVGQFFTILVFLFSLLGTPNMAVQAATTVNFEAEADADIDQASPTSAWGTYGDVWADGGASVQANSLYRWNLSSIPAGSSVVSASLTFRVIQNSAYDFGLYSLRRTWVENNTTWNTYDGINSWGTAGAMNTTLDRYTTDLWDATAATFGATGTVTIPLNAAGLAVVQGWLATPASNFGLTIQSITTGPTSDPWVVYSSEDTMYAGPTLNLTYGRAPVVSDIPNQTIAEGAGFTTILLDDYVTDADNTDAQMTWTYSGNTALGVSIVNRVATITTPNAEWSGAETITFRATDPDGLYAANDAVFTVTAVPDAPVVSAIPDQTILEGASFATILLDSYVADVDNADAEMTWTYTGNSQLTVSIVDRVATIAAPNADWNGAETITFRATDPGALYSEDAAAFTVTSVPDAPVVSGIPDQTIAEGASFATINLDGYVTDADNTDAEMTWSYSGNSQLTVSITDRIATITAPNAEWSGAETITFRAADPGALYGEDAAAFTVTAVNDAPVVSDIPGQTIAEGASFTAINLDSFVSDADNTDAEMTWTYSGNTDLTVSIVDRVATIAAPNADWSGSETITFTATDPGALFGEDGAAFTVTAVNDDAPVVTDIPNQTIAEGASFATINLDGYVSDGDNTDTEMTWSYTGNTELTVSIVDRIATISVPNADWNGSETITFRATDPGALFGEDGAAFTVTAVPDAPVVSGIPDQTIAMGGSFATVSLDGYVSDVDSADADMVWTYSGNSQLTVSIVDRVATISVPNADWNGSETITFRATDPGALYGEDAAVFSVNAPVPVLTVLAPASILAGSGDTTLTVDGSNFVDGAQVYWNGAARATTFVSAAQLTAVIPAADLAAVSANAVTAVNPNSGGTPSNALTVNVHTFADSQPGDWHWNWVEGFYAKRITGGCDINPFRYCPDRAVTRAEMAVFILKALNVDTPAYAPDPAQTGIFADVPVADKEWMQAWIEEFYEQGITGGCDVSPFRYCPERQVTRAEMAVFILRAVHGPSYTPPAATGVFADVPVLGKEWMQPWVEQFYNEGISGGCDVSPLRYCPERPATRAEMATFIDRAFSFPQEP